MPAAAVIPALKMHRTIAAVKKLVVGSAPVGESPPREVVPVSTGYLTEGGCALHGEQSAPSFYFEQIRVLSTGVSPECSCME